MANELIKAGFKFLVGVAALATGGTLLKKGNENLKTHRDSKAGKKQ